MSDLCIECMKLVRPRQHAITCDSCDRWQHRTCGNTGVSKSEYLRAVRDQLDIAFKCNPCTSRQRDVTINMSTDGNSRTASSTDFESLLNTASLDLEFSIECLETSISLLHLTKTSSDSDDTDDIRTPSDLNKTYVISSNTDGRISYGEATSDEIVFDNARDEPADCNVIYGSSIGEASLTNTFLEEDAEVTYEVVEQGSNRLKKLVSSDGFSYCVKKQTTSSTYWRCSVRRKHQTCYARVTQKGDIFRRGENGHCHLPDPLVMKRIIIKRDIKREAVRDIHVPAGRIVKNKMLETFERNDFALPHPDALTRIVNRARQKIRPEGPEKPIGKYRDSEMTYGSNNWGASREKVPSDN